LSYLNINPADIDSFIGAKMSGAESATINHARVSENPFNKLALELSKKEKELNRYESSLLEKEAEIEKNSSLINNEVLAILSFAMATLFVLVLINFYLDHKRRKKIKQNADNNKE